MEEQKHYISRERNFRLNQRRPVMMISTDIITKDFKPEEIAIYVYVEYCTDNSAGDGWYPTAREVSKKFNMSLRKVIKICDCLINAGLLERSEYCEE